MLTHPFRKMNSVAVTAVGFLLSVSAFAADPATYKMAAMGDSITVAFNAINYFGDSPEASWSTGTTNSGDFESHLQRLQKKFRNTKISAFNYGVTGAKVKDLAKQVKKVNSTKPDYLTLLIGANDVCHWSADYQDALDEMSQTLKQYLDSIVATNPNIKITMSAIPDIYHVWEVNKDESSCHTIWNITGICRPLLGGGASDGDRQAFRVRLQHANSALASIAAQYPQNIKFSDVAETYQFDKDDISRNDCFHPTVKGQATISREIWKQSWFANDDDMLISEAN